MFGSLFGKKKPKRFTAKIAMTRSQLDQLLIDQITKQEVMVVFFFNTSKNKLLSAMNTDLETNLIMADQIMSGTAIPKIRTFLSQSGKSLVLGERHPLNSHENDIVGKLESAFISLPVTAYCALDDAFMLRFGGERMSELMKSMGIKENELIEHAIIEKSIEKAQEKFTNKTLTDSKTNSPEEWLRNNLQT